MVFLPDGKMLVAELGGTIRLVLPPYTQIQSTPFFQISNLGRNGVEQGLYDIAIDPNFATNHYIYVSYTLGSPNHDRLSRFTVNAASTGVVAGSELVLYEDTQNSGADHHGGAIMFGNDGKIYFATGDDLVPAASQSLSSPRGKILRINPDGTVPTDNPFYDGAGPNYDAIWALGLRNPFRAFYDAPTGQMFIGDVGGNDWNTAIEELNLGVRGANYGWPNVEAPNGNPAYTAPIYYYTHIVNGTPRDAAITAGFVYRGTQFPAAYQGNFFFADYVQNWIKRATLDANGNVTGVFNFEPLDGSLDGTYGDIVKMVQGPEGALYYVDIGFSDRDVASIWRQQDPPHQLRQFRSAAGRCRVRQPDTGPDSPHGQLLERRLIRSRRQTTDLSVELWRQHDFDAGQPNAYLQCRRPLSGTAHGFRWRKLHNFSTAEHQCR